MRRDCLLRSRIRERTTPRVGWTSNTPVGERQLPAGDVYITNVSVDYESGATDTVAWAELDDGIGPTDAINGEARRVNLGSVGIVQILWQQDDVERVIEAWVFDDDVS